MTSDATQGGAVRGRVLRRFAVAALAIAAVAAVWIGVFGAVRAYRYMEDDPAFCRTCHTMRTAWDQWESGEHAGVGCHSCHKSDPIGSLRQVWRYITRQPDDVEARAEVTAATCMSCHRFEEGAVVSATVDAHHGAGERAECAVCHGQELHHLETPAWSEICATCH